MSSQTDKDALRALYTAYIARANAYDIEGMASFYAPSITFNSETKTPAEALAPIKPVTEAFENWRLDVKHLTIDGDLISSHIELSGIHKGTFMGVEATGRSVKLQEMALYRVKDGKFVDVWVVLDMFALMQQIS